MTALDLVPYRIQGGAGRPIRDADQYLETIMCPYVRSCFDLAMGGEYAFLSGIVIPHTCDAMHRIYDTWMYYVKPSFGHCLTVPHMTHRASFEFFEAELEGLKRNLERFAGRSASEGDLQDAIGLHNRSRALLRELYELRKSDPPLVSGVEVTQVLVAGMTIPVQEFIALLEGVLAEVRSRKPDADKRPRLFISGSEVDDASLVRLAEECGAWVVMDDVCTGSRAFWLDVDASKGAISGLAQRYLGGLTCPCTYRDGKAAERFGYLERYVRDWGAQGALLYTIRFCDTYQLDAPEIMEYMRSLGLPVLYLEDDYIKPPLAQWKTRIEAFLETIESGRQE
jgi:benzoyl-CoA reductase/2-hydroxyglutaryl-CoA dehydratase subunit BcrC/BadD/HgdB